MESPRRKTGARTAASQANEQYSSQMHSSHPSRRDGVCENLERKCCHIPEKSTSRRDGGRDDSALAHESWATTNGRQSSPPACRRQAVGIHLAHVAHANEADGEARHFGRRSR